MVFAASIQVLTLIAAAAGVADLVQKGRSPNYYVNLVYHISGYRTDRGGPWIRWHRGSCCWHGQGPFRIISRAFYPIAFLRAESGLVAGTNNSFRQYSPHGAPPTGLP